MVFAILLNNAVSQTQVLYWQLFSSGNDVIQYCIFDAVVLFT